jgi:hypothetical protein
VSRNFLDETRNGIRELTMPFSSPARADLQLELKQMSEANRGLRLYCSKVSHMVLDEEKKRSSDPRRLADS